MNAHVATPRSAERKLGELLRHWRAKRGKSQLELSLDTGVSQRHLSFIESGRSVPSRQTLEEIAQALQIPLRERNALWSAAGYAAPYSEGAWDALEMQAVTQVLERVLHQHEPFPALVLDRHWNVIMTNQSAPRFFSGFVDLEAREKPRNMLHLMFDPKGLRPFVANWEEVAQSLIQRVYRESIGGVLDDQTKALLAALRAYPEVDTRWDQIHERNSPAILPFVPMRFIKDDQVLSYFSMVTTVGTPQTVAAQELRIECMYPADHKTDLQHRAIMSRRGRATAPVPTPSPDV
jgi:transcriptional regulator with XRE-family HTH domain